MKTKKKPRPRNAKTQGLKTKTALAVWALDELKKFHAGRLSHLAREKKDSDNQKETQQQAAFRILIGTILSHRTKDAKTEQATTALLKHYKTPQQLAKAPHAKVRALIKPVGFYNSKAKYVVKCSQELVERFGGNVPNTFELLTMLTGVGRKTAGCVLAYAFELPAIPVDSHVHQIANRLGIVRTSDPLETEAELMNVMPRNRWIDVNELLVLHGQTICVPVSPMCSRCSLQTKCPKIGVKARR